MSKTDLTTGQVAERMGVSVHAVRFWIKRGLLPHAYERPESRGAVWMIPESDLEGFAPPKKTGRPPKPKGSGSGEKITVKRARKAKGPARS
jgi:hypothetical protein